LFRKRRGAKRVSIDLREVGGLDPLLDSP
jgi:hypothetical protein